MSKQRKPRRSRAKNPNGLPKGAYPLPGGNYATETTSPQNARGQSIKVVAVHRAEPDAKLVADALIELALNMINDQELVDH